MKAVLVQPNDAAMVDEVLGFEIVVTARLIHNKSSALQVSTFHTLLDNLHSLRADRLLSAMWKYRVLATLQNS